MANPLVAFDESGHTGEDLLNDRQPIFALASVHLSDAQTDEALKLLYNRPGQEVKFKNLKKSEAGIRKGNLPAQVRVYNSGQYQSNGFS
jgi:hypothetical protein